jgi:hypothetical protein
LAVAAAVVPPAFAADPGRMSQTRVLPSGSSGAFGERMGALWDGIVGDSPRAASAAFFPRTAYLQVKAIPSAGSDYSDRLLANFAADIRAAHRLVSAGGPAMRRRSEPHSPSQGRPRTSSGTRRAQAQIHKKR